MVDMEIVGVDNAGRLIIPKDIRKRMGINEHSKLLITDVKDDIIVIKKMNIWEIVKRLQDELKGVDIDKIQKEVEAETNEEARKKYPQVLG
ncbi:MAG: AbrB/MazE/SpoVT family DNA-binding domain-containing protein [Methanosarcinales archaeon Met12]|nr:MAG: AbrB/MazE/SpoVT family DNA-binding domain-containing protein [Methanosarcinales archaeon Met12]